MAVSGLWTDVDVAEVHWPKMVGGKKKGKFQ